MLSVAIKSIMLSVIKLSVVKLSVIMLSVIMLSVVEQACGSHIIYQAHINKTSIIQDTIATTLSILLGQEPTQEWNV